MGLREARKRAGKRAEDVAALFGISRAAVYLWESGRSMPRADKIRRLAEYYHCSVDDLLGDDKCVGER